MNGQELVRLLDAALARLADSREELRDLDAALGDGDLGITVSKGCEALRARLAELAEPTLTAILRTAAMAFSSANPSTFAALVGGGLLAASRSIDPAAEFSVLQARVVARTIADTIAAKGKSNIGDKTILDALIPSIEVLDADDTGGDGQAIVAAMIRRANEGVAATTMLQSRRGRAAWLGERSVGKPDAGAVAYVRFLEAVHTAWPSPS